MRFLSLLLFGLLVSNSSAQTVKLIGDINQGEANSILSEENIVIQYEDELYFSAKSEEYGFEVFKYDGDSAMVLKDINPGSADSEARNFYIVDGTLLFTANDGVHGAEWWITDGTEEGTVMLKDIYEGEEDGVWTGNSNSFTSFHYIGDELLFVGQDNDRNYELWKTDGTADGTILVKNLGPDNTSFFVPSFPSYFVDFKNEVYFSSQVGFWKTDGTEAGTVLILDEKEDGGDFSPTSVFSNGDFMVMRNNPGVWVSDGTKAGTQLLKEQASISLNWFGNIFESLGDIILFPGDDGENGDELWRTDGTEEGTFMVTDLWPGPDGYAPQNTIVFNGEYFFKGNDGSSGFELFKSDGTAAGTKIVKEIKTGSGGAFSGSTSISTNGNKIYFGAGTSPFKIGLWESNGTESGTKKVEIADNLLKPNRFYYFDDKVFFYAQSDNFGFEPYIYDPMGVSVDNDNDGFDADADCDDDNAAINPGAQEIAYNGIDDDCDPATLDDDLDADGFTNDVDCDDDDPLINPDAEEIVNNDVDENCDGEIGTSSTFEVDGISVSIHPNPVNDFIHINTQVSFQVNVIDITGRSIFEGRDADRVSVQNWKAGHYILKIKFSNSDKQLIKKIVVVK